MRGAFMYDVRSKRDKIPFSVRHKSKPLPCSTAKPDQLVQCALTWNPEVPQGIGTSAQYLTVFSEAMWPHGTKQ